MSLLDQYLTMMEPMKGSRIYHTWSVLTAASAMLERRVWLDRGGPGPTFPNLYTILVGPPATGKGFAILQARSLIDELTYPIGSLPIKIGPTKITQAALYQELREAEREFKFPGLSPKKQCPLFVAPEELAVHMVDFGGGTLTNELIDFWDSKGLDYVTVKRIVTGGQAGITTLRNPSLTILGGSTASFLQEAAKQKLVVSGLASRMIFVVEPNEVEIQDNYVPIDQAARAELKLIFLRMFAMKGPMRFDADGQARYGEISKASRAQSYAVKSEFLQGYFGRKGVNVSKVALILAASEGRYLIGRADLDQALALIEYIEADMNKAFGMRMINKDDSAGQTMMSLIPYEPEAITQGDLLYKLMQNGMFMPANGELSSIMKGMELSGEVIVSRLGEREIYSRRRRKP